MAQMYDSITPEFREFIAEQPVFFTATAPTTGRINLSPKGMDTLRVLDERTVVYLDLTGSGNETAAHLRDDGRITVMFCSFGKTPMVLRLYGHGRVIHPSDSEWDRLHGLFATYPGERQIMLIAVESALKSCGWNVPRMELIERRDGVTRYWAKKGGKAVAETWRRYNSRSIDGLPTGVLDDTGHGAAASDESTPAVSKALDAMGFNVAKPSSR